MTPEAIRSGWQATSTPTRLVRQALSKASGELQYTPDTAESC